METKKIKVIVKDVDSKDGKKFKKYSMVLENGKTVDLRFKKETNLNELNICKKAIIEVGYLSDASASYEYPRYYAGDIVSLEKIY